MSNKWVGGLVIILLVGGAFYFGSRYTGELPKFGTSSTGENNGQQVAVTLDNGLIYFGLLTDEEKDYVKLSDAYFAQTNPNAPKPDDKKPATPSTEPAYLLTKVGDTEVYGPESTMFINREHVLIIQKLRADSNVIKTIKEGNKKN